MRDYLHIGPVPADEDCLQVGYASEANMRAECRKYAAKLILAFPPPPGTSLRVKACPHDFGTYYEVIVEFDDNDEGAAQYALMVESDSPGTWAELDQLIQSNQANEGATPNVPT